MTAGTFNSNYGFPLPWKTITTVECPGGLNQAPCLTDVVFTNYNWSYFALDALFYTAVGYVLILAYKRTIHRAERETNAHSAYGNPAL